MEIEEEFLSINSEDLWIYNKLQLSRMLNYNCGPAGMKVHSSGFYIARPCINFLGMGRNARKVYLSSSTEELLQPGEFWCEIFKGEHLSVDFYRREPVLVVKGFRNVKNSFSQWNSWCKVKRDVKFPSILEKISNNYEWINCEFIGNKLIEVHLRTNPNFRYQNSVAIPIWKDSKKIKYDFSRDFTFVNDVDEKRIGFWIK